MIIKPGMRLINTDDPRQSFGTVGGLVKSAGDADPLLLTCFHCVFLEGMSWDDTRPAVHQNLSILNPDTGSYEAAATVVRTLRNHFADVALIRPAAGHSADGGIFTWGKTQKTLDLADGDVNTTWLRKYGGETKDTYGKYQGIKPEFSAYYPGETEPYPLKFLLKINTPNGTKFADGGDSGSLVLNTSNQVAGMIVMVDAQFSYAIPAAMIETQFNIKFI